MLYASTSLSQVAAIDPESGATLWLYDPKTYEGRTPPNHGFVHRGVAYWADGNDQRILFGTGDAYLIALDATTGQPIPTFGQGGRIDLWQGLHRRGPLRQVYGVTSPPIVCRDSVVVGASIVDFPRHEMPPGDIRGFDIRTGAQRWMVPVGDNPRNHSALKALQLPPLGWPFRIHTLLTKSLLFGGQQGNIKRVRDSKRGFALEFDLETLDPKLWAFDKATGAIVAEIALPDNVNGAPMTYMAGGRQYFVVAVDGANLPAELVALRLP